MAAQKCLLDIKQIYQNNEDILWKLSCWNTPERSIFCDGNWFILVHHYISDISTTPKSFPHIMVNRCNTTGCYTNYPAHDTGLVLSLLKEEKLWKSWIKYLSRKDVDFLKNKFFFREKHFERNCVERMKIECAWLRLVILFQPYSQTPKVIYRTPCL